MKVNSKNEFILRTRKVESYFRGKIKLWDGEWHITCSSYAGGIPSILPILDFRAKTKKMILDKIQKFKTKHKLISK